MNTKENIKANNINLINFLEFLGEDVMVHGTTAYKLQRHDSLIITKKNPNLFFWNSRAVGGNVYTLMEKLYGFDKKQQKEVIKVYLEELNTNKFIPTKIINNVNEKKEKIEIQFKDIKNKETINIIEDYLIKKRGLTKQTINNLMKSNLLSVDLKNNIYFKVYDKNGEFEGFDITGTTGKKFKSNTTNSKGFNIVLDINKKVDSLYIFESTIDLLSYVDLKKDEILEEQKNKNFRLLAMSGLKISTINNYMEDNIQKIYVCTDNDEKGEKFFNMLQQEYKNVEIIRKIPKNKDFNEDLQDLQQIKNKWNFRSNDTREL